MENVIQEKERGQLIEAQEAVLGRDPGAPSTRRESRQGSTLRMQRNEGGCLGWGMGLGCMCPHS